MTNHGRRMATGLALAALTLFLVIQGADAAGPAQPHGLSAHALAQAPALPYLAWSAVSGADHYQVQVAADPAFKAPVFSAGLGDFTTANTRATLRKTLPSHRYWWRVRAASKAGSVSGWSTSSFALSWNRSVSPDRSGGPNVLRWRPITGAVSYSRRAVVRRPLRLAGRRPRHHDECGLRQPAGDAAEEHLLLAGDADRCRGETAGRGRRGPAAGSSSGLGLLRRAASR